MHNMAARHAGTGGNIHSHMQTYALLIHALAWQRGKRCWQAPSTTCGHYQLMLITAHTLCVPRLMTVTAPGC
jgi:hypothetical protein